MPNPPGVHTDPVEDAVVDSLPAAFTVHRLHANWRNTARALIDALDRRGYTVAVARPPEGYSETPPDPSPLPVAASMDCTCDTGPNTDGPDQGCPQHGDVRWYAEAYFVRDDLLRRLGEMLSSDESDDDVRRRALNLVREETGHAR